LKNRLKSFFCGIRITSRFNELPRLDFRQLTAKLQTKLIQLSLSIFSFWLNLKFSPVMIDAKQSNSFITTTQNCPMSEESRRRIGSAGAWQEFRIYSKASKSRPVRALESRSILGMARSAIHARSQSMSYMESKKDQHSV